MISSNFPSLHPIFYDTNPELQSPVDGCAKLVSHGQLIVKVNQFTQRERERERERENERERERESFPHPFFQLFVCLCVYLSCFHISQCFREKLSSI